MRNLGFLSLVTVLAMGAAPANASPFGNSGSDTSGWTLVTGVGCQDAHWVQGPVALALTAGPGGESPITTQPGGGHTAGPPKVGEEPIPPAVGSGADSGGGSGSG